MNLPIPVPLFIYFFLGKVLFGFFAQKLKLSENDFSVGDTGGLDIKMDKNNRRVLLIGVEPRNDLLVTGPDAYH